MDIKSRDKTVRYVEDNNNKAMFHRNINKIYKSTDI